MGWYQIIGINLSAFVLGLAVLIMSFLGGYAAFYFFAGIWIGILILFILSRFLKFPFLFRGWTKKRFAYLYTLAVIYSLICYFGVLCSTYSSCRCALAFLKGQAFWQNCKDGKCSCKVY